MKALEFLSIAALGLTLAACSPTTHNSSPTTTTSATPVAEKATQDAASIYAMDMQFQDQHGNDVSWQSLEGRPRVVAMIFTHCPSACPRITHDMQTIQQSLPPNEQKAVQFTLISFDSKRDTPNALEAFAELHQLNANWLLLHGDPENVRMAAALLNVKYKEWPSGDFTHENVIFVIDKDGHIATRQIDNTGDNLKSVSQSIASTM